MSIFTPDDEPYRGRESVFRFDEMIIIAMEKNSKIGPWTHGNDLSPLQLAASEIIPHGCSIALSIRELIRQGYLISAEILIRPLMERATVVSYLSETPEAVTLWEQGWPHKSRPPLFKMLANMKGTQGGNLKDVEDEARKVTEHFNHIVHADPQGARRQVTKLDNDVGVYTVSKSINDTKVCDDICTQAMCYLFILVTRAVQIFPEALTDHDVTV